MLCNKCLSLFSSRSTLICFLWKRACRQNCSTLWERSPATWHEVLLAFILLSFYCHCCCSLWDTSRKKKENQRGGYRNKKCGRDVKSPSLWRCLSWCWMDVGKRSEQTKARKNERKSCKRAAKEKSSQPASGYTNWVPVACSAKTDQERAAWSKFLLCWGVCTGQRTDIGGIPADISVFHHATQQLPISTVLVERRPI